MVQLCQKDKEKVYDTIKSGHIDAADMAFPNLIDSIIPAMKKHGFLAPIVQVLGDKRVSNQHIPLGSSLYSVLPQN